MSSGTESMPPPEFVGVGVGDNPTPEMADDGTMSEVSARSSSPVNASITVFDHSVTGIDVTPVYSTASLPAVPPDSPHLPVGADSSSTDRTTPTHLQGRPPQRAIITEMKKAKAEKRAGGTPSSGGSGPRKSNELLSRQLLSVENELHDTKRLLLDALCDKKDLEAQKAELTSCIAELTGNLIDEEETSEMVTDRAKRTMMRLRMERTENVKAKLLSVVRVKTSEISSKCQKLKELVAGLKTEFEGQMERFGAVLSTNTTAFEKIADEMRKLTPPARSPSAGGLAVPTIGSPGAGAGSYLDLVTAAVQEQQKSIVLPPDHPIIGALKQMLDAFDNMTKKVNRSWEKMRCFRDGKPPEILKPRRFVDPIVNIGNYEQLCVTMGNYVEYADVATLLFGELQLPQLERSSHRMIAAVDEKLRTKIEAAFHAMRVIRSPTSLSDRSVANIFRLFGAAEGVPQKQLASLTDQFKAAARSHTKRCFKYIAAMLKCTSSFAKADRKQEDLTQEQLMQYYRNPIEASPNSTSSQSGCVECQIPMVCEDCLSIHTQPMARRRLLLQRRRLILDFTEARVKHLTMLNSLVDEVLLALRKARVISLQALQLATRPEAVSSGGGGGDGSPAKGKDEGSDFKSPQKFKAGSGGGRKDGSPGRRRSPAKSSQEDTSQRRLMERKPTLATALLLQKGGASAIKSSTNYFENLRKHRKENEAKLNPISSSAVLEGMNQRVGPPRTSSEQERFIEDLQFLERLAPQKPNSARGAPRSRMHLNTERRAPGTAQGGTRQDLGTSSGGGNEQRRGKLAVGGGVTLDTNKLGPLIDPEMASSLAKAMQNDRGASLSRSSNLTEDQGPEPNP